MMHTMEQAGNLGFDAKMHEPFVIAPNLGSVAMEQLMHAEIISPFDNRLSTVESQDIIAATRKQEDVYQTPFQAVRTLIRSTDNGSDLEESLFVTCTAERGIDARLFKLDKTTLLGVMQYVGLVNALGREGQYIDVRPPRRPVDKVFRQATDYGDVWTSTLLDFPGHTDALKSGTMRGFDPVISTIDPTVSVKSRKILKSQKHISYHHPYRVRPVVAIPITISS